MKRLLLLCLFACGPSRTVTIPAQLQRGLIEDTSVIKSYSLWVLELVGRDNQPVDCRLLLDGTKKPPSPEIIVIKRIDGTFGEDAGVLLEDLPVGSQNRIFYVDMFDQPDQLGVIVAKGCAPSVTIEGGKRVEVEIVIDRPPRAE